ncbi:MAG: hypothetical protein J5787_02270 [Alphaproteobacteria bacterium]|nr:hypothetical protein [Alphaproteobacteria bacterium]MBO4643958.1 hypothetical protein [Alphaproteobacteria bacterium]
MADLETIFVKMLIPQKPLSVKEVISVEIPAVDGPYLVLPKRAPAMKLLKAGMVVIKDADQGNIEKYFVSAGIAKIRDNACTILAHFVQNADEVNLADIKKELSVYREKEEKEIHLDEIDLKKIAFLQMIAGHFEK